MMKKLLILFLVTSISHVSNAYAQSFGFKDTAEHNVTDLVKFSTLYCVAGDVCEVKGSVAVGSLSCPFSGTTKYTQPILNNCDDFTVSVYMMPDSNGRKSTLYVDLIDNRSIDYEYVNNNLAGYYYLAGDTLFRQEVILTTTKAQKNELARTGHKEVGIW